MNSGDSTTSAATFGVSVNMPSQPHLASHTSDNKVSDTFGFVVNLASPSLTKGGYVVSRSCKIRDVPWKLAASKGSCSNTESLDIHLHCVPDENGLDCTCEMVWNCFATFKITLLNESSGDHIVREHDFVFHSGCSSYGGSFTSWDSVTDPKNGFNFNNSIMIRADVVVGIPVNTKCLVMNDKNNISKLLESERKIQSLESEITLLKNDLALEKHNVLQLQNDLPNEKSEFQAMKNDIAEEKAELQQLENEVASEKADVGSKTKSLETIDTNVVSQISEMKNIEESVAGNASTNSSMEDNTT